ncbi:DMT family transporter [Roseomonas sp. E05]|uniref:DMT family transporter n=1 Tax=Roseomonas sp. E05 TaxID=3046310 RepID=UPI0024B8FC8E|nr:DMT family transporter [Roseomonas sp. E05]MDJ0389430.1 DMT family transporter [Roseomonas sp. E05]
MSQHVARPLALRGLPLRLGSFWARLSPTLRGMAWMALSGLSFCLLNGLMSGMTREMEPFQAQFLRYVFGFAVMLPLLWRQGLTAFAPNGLSGQLWRGVVHTAGLLLWFLALPHIPLADVTALGFTGPIFIMFGAVVFLKEKVVLSRWVAAAVGLVGVAIVLGPKLSGGGGWTLMMLASSPLFAASFLITKALTRRDRPEVIVMWQAITISLFTLPFALPLWIWPTPAQLGWFVVAGLLGSFGHWCLTEAFRLADVSATQPVKFLDLAWAALLGFLLFGDVPGWTTYAGAAVIFASATWMARREAAGRG